jgi:hypothetical protein
MCPGLDCIPYKGFGQAGWKMRSLERSGSTEVGPARQAGWLGASFACSGEPWKVLGQGMMARDQCVWMNWRKVSKTCLRGSYRLQAGFCGL